MRELQFFGIGGAINYNFAPNCAALTDNHNFVIIDPNIQCIEKLIKNEILCEQTTEIFIVITHTHADHISGLGPLIWQCGIIYKKRPVILANSKKFKRHIEKLLTMMGVDKKYYTFSLKNNITFNNINIQARKTIHTPDLDCFGIEFQDSEGKYYYSGDTKDCEYIKTIISNNEYKDIYIEVSNYPKLHMDYEALKKLIDTKKLIAMHFESLQLYEQVKKEKLLKLPKEFD